VRAAEVSADDVWLALTAVEEPAGLGGELGLVAGPAVHGQTPFEVGVDQLVEVHGEPVARAAHDGRAPLGAPGTAGDLVGTDADLIGEEHLATLGIAGQVSSRQTGPRPRPARPRRSPDARRPGVHAAELRALRARAVAYGCALHDRGKILLDVALAVADRGRALLLSEKNSKDNPLSSLHIEHGPG
jgi:hypothetical protein